MKKVETKVIKQGYLTADICLSSSILWSIRFLGDGRFLEERIRSWNSDSMKLHKLLVKYFFFPLWILLEIF